MEKVYKAFYKTSSVCADGYVVIKEDRTIEGLFALDYMYIHYLEDNTILFLKSSDFKNFNGFCKISWKNFEFSSSKKIVFYPYKSYCFFPTTSLKSTIQNLDGLSLEIKEEIFDVEKIKNISYSIMKLRS